MSREADLVDLIQTANEIYLINTQGNARSAYIRIDDLRELIARFERKIQAALARLWGEEEATPTEV